MDAENISKILKFLLNVNFCKIAILGKEEMQIIVDFKWAPIKEVYSLAHSLSQLFGCRVTFSVIFEDIKSTILVQNQEANENFVVKMYAQDDEAFCLSAHLFK